MLDLELIRNRMVELGVHDAEFTMRVGTSLSELRCAGSLAGLSVDAVVRIADLLGIDINLLLGRAPSRKRAPASDDSVIEAALSRHGQVHERDLATALRWKLSRVREAVQDLQVRLIGTGLHLVRVGDLVHLEAFPEFLTAEIDEVLATQAQRRLPLTLIEAVHLMSALHSTAAHGYVDPGSAEVLGLRGLVHREAGELPTLHADVLYAIDTLA
ncbi:hypothetical protein [Nonomuraea sp. NPDC050310]|uniref:hypothetical protein n=1 Tax=Nonomuraea sp. NPDC050310 TaxID=3154935 RepID=UPI0033EB3CF5